MATSVATEPPEAPQSASIREHFNRAADRLTRTLGSLPALIASILLVIVWLLTGPLFNFSETWQLFINTITTIVTFWMVFVIQNSANRSSKATQLKLDEIIRSLADARNGFISLDTATEAILTEREAEMVQFVKDDADDPGTPAH